MLKDVPGEDSGVGASGELPEWDADTPFTIPKSLLSRVAKFEVPHEIGTGTLAWGDSERGFIGDPKQRPKAAQGEFNPADLQGAFETMLESGLAFFDTAETYGSKSIKDGMSAEQLLGRFIQESQADARPMVGAKYTPVLWPGAAVGGLLPRAGRRAVVKALQRSLDRLGLAYVDLYSLHFPTGRYIGGLGALAEGLAQARERGLCRHVGVCNMNGAQASVRDFKEKLAKFDVPLIANQIEYSLADQTAAEDGTIAECKRQGILVFAHTPLGRGLATGVNTASDPTGGRPGAPRYVFRDLEPLLPVHQALAAVATMASSRLSQDESAPIRKVTTTQQISINYIRAKGLVPLPGITNRKQALEVAGCLGWRLNGEEVEMLDDAYQQYKAKAGGAVVKRSPPPQRR
ncbi:NADP-dependent oxidoreductase domain-containing protein [Tribonema minus]|uniref:NADP-dependent oxidoreductase domain-containing protein n=1 Tax=Tribonema minus TaxID=303371 RepID=A0A835Z353_9STRA|nr:NADP-dependent oxidoreductase domain-containing protein [Tribonema minus]